MQFLLIYSFYLAVTYHTDKTTYKYHI